MKPIRKLVVAGVGLIGGSFALALRQAGLVEQVVGIGRSVANLETARTLQVIDQCCYDWEVALADAELVLLAAPVGQMDAMMAAMAPYLQPGTLITDAGSTKADVIDAIYRHLGAHLPWVVPAHPIAGAEKSGAAAANPALYQQRKVVVTPLPENTAEAIARVHAVWTACGADVLQMTPQQHDATFAAVSHLPHLLAFGLVKELADRPDAANLFRFAASGFRDFTRIAASHPEMWRDICLANRNALLTELDAYCAELAQLRHLLMDADGAGLQARFEQARQARTLWAEGHFN